MSEKKDRRYLERLEINGAAISIRREKGLSLLERFSEPKPVKDITWSSVRFETEKNLKTGEVVELEIIVPGEKKIRVKGHLVWTAKNSSRDTGYAVVQFLPFGAVKPYNPLKCREQLKKLLNKYSGRKN